MMCSMDGWGVGCDRYQVQNHQRRPLTSASSSRQSSHHKVFNVKVSKNREMEIRTKRDKIPGLDWSVQQHRLIALIPRELAFLVERFRHHRKRAVRQVANPPAESDHALIQRSGNLPAQDFLDLVARAIHINT